MRGGRAEPQVPVEVLGRVARGGQVAWFAKLPVAPRADFLQLADSAVPDEFPHAIEILVFMALGADLGGELGLVLEIVGADHAGFLHAVGQRLFAVDMLAAIHRPVGDEGVRMIGGAADHRLDVLLVEALPPVHVLLGAGELLRRKGQVLLVHVAEGDDVFFGEAVEERGVVKPQSGETGAATKSEDRNPKPETNLKGGKGKKYKTAGPGAVLSLSPSGFGFKLARPYCSLYGSRVIRE